MDLLKLLQGFVKVVHHISRPLPNKTKLEFDQDFKVKVLNGSKYSMPRVHCAWAMFKIILCPQCSRTPWSHTKRFHTHTPATHLASAFLCLLLNFRAPQLLLSSISWSNDLSHCSILAMIQLALSHYFQCLCWTLYQFLWWGCHNNLDCPTTSDTGKHTYAVMVRPAMNSKKMRRS